MSKPTGTGTDTDPSTEEEHYPDTDDNSRVTKEHRALQNQSSVRAIDYPKADRQAASLVDKSKSAAGSVVNAQPKQDDTEEN